MKRIFGSAKPQQPKQSLQDIIARTDTRVDSTDAKINKIDMELTKYKDQMAKMRDGPSKDSLKQRAINLLRQKKLYEAQRDQMAQQSFMMEQTNLASESLSMTSVTIDAMKTAAVQMKKEHSKINLDKIQDLHSELDDLLLDNSEIQDILARPFGNMPENIDEADLDAELALLGDDMFQENEPDILNLLPNAPRTIDPTPNPE